MGFISNDIVKDNTNLDFEKHQSVTLKIKVTDSGSPALNAEADITVNITDVNEKPTIKNQTFSIAENSANGTEVTQIATLRDRRASCRERV